MQYRDDGVYAATVRFRRDLPGHYFTRSDIEIFDGRRFRLRCQGPALHKFLPRHDDEWVFLFDPPKMVFPTLAYILSGDLEDIRFLPPDVDPLKGERRCLPTR
jgi:hypothetical protein